MNGPPWESSLAYRSPGGAVADPEGPYEPHSSRQDFVHQSWRELRKVRWPSRHAALVYVRVIIGFVVVVGVFVVCLDLLFSR